MILRHFYKILFTLLLLTLPLSLYANNVTVSNISLTDPDGAGETINVEFDISWGNSWRGSINHDAAWVFVKYSTDSGSTWNHATLKTSDTSTGYDKNNTSLGYSQGTGTELDIIVPDDNTTTAGGGYGAFLERSYPGAGTVDTNDINLVWDWGTDGLTGSTQARVKVFAIEMVYIPQGSFYIGDGNGGTESTYAFHENGVGNTPVQITTTSKNITCDNTSYNDDIDTTPVAVDGDGGITGNANWPTGYEAFYCMKYEVTQAAYRDFLNMLPLAQQETRTAATLDGDETGDYVMVGEDGGFDGRQTITTESDPGSGPYTFGCDLDNDNTVDEANDGEWQAMNYINWMDLCAYADWSALRPMTELEFEKACRGPMDAVYAEYPWGTLDNTEAENVTNEGMINQISTESGKGLSNYYSATYGPGGALRNGFAATSSTNRQTSGASYYDVMEMGGNVWERAVTLGNSSGRNFDGTHGDGVLTTATNNEGNATNTGWPGIDGTPSYGVTGGTGGGYRGGSWGWGPSVATVSSRDNAAETDTVRYSDDGGRCVRTAP
ncbi:MAG: SUMF1/EgtB/PvdO family nonheme iron enzyme [Candidatus Omnitrophica bacterium]|nr:SUMF1/EgtB/PvdO family nonheme iron enzyme [Candidatus Omnitrophota bacterium]MDD5080784.1 SUMF1/EgtB/PvdO family nonheme iron enzyme [Candidatus Omnitrophota bacterium]